MTQPLDTVRNLDDLIAPLTLQDFTAHYRHRQPLHLAPGAAGPTTRFDRLLPLDGLDGVLAAAAGCADDWDFIGPHGLFDRREFTSPSRQVQLNRLASLYAQGGNIYLSHLQCHAATLTPLWRQLTQALRTDVAMNLWLTRGDAAAPYLHSDDHELFILQLQGTQQWTVYGQAAPGYVPPAQSGELDRGTHGEPELQLALEPGALLYLPPDRPCEVLPCDGFSMHIAISVFALRWHDVLRSALTELDLRGHALAEAVPPTMAGDAPALRRQLGAQAHAALQQLDGETLARRLESHYVNALPPPQDGHFGRELMRDAGLAPHTRLRRRDAAPCLLHSVARDDHASIAFPGGGGLAGPAALAPLLRFVAQTGTFSANDLPGDFDPDSRTLLLQRLLRMGLLERCG